MNSVGNAIHSFTACTCNTIQVKSGIAGKTLCCYNSKSQTLSVISGHWCYNNSVLLMFLLSSGQSGFIHFVMNILCTEDGRQVPYQNVVTCSFLCHSHTVSHTHYKCISIVQDTWKYVYGWTKSYLSWSIFPILPHIQFISLTISLFVILC